MNEEENRKNEDIVAYSSYERKNKVKRLIRIITVLTVITALALFVSWFVLNTYFDVEMIIVDGTDKYSYVDVCEKSGVLEGQIMFTVSQKKVENNLKNAFPYVKSADVVKDYSDSSINIVIYEEKPLFYTFTEGEYYVLTNELKVLERFEDFTSLSFMYPQLKELKTPEIYKIVAPNRVVFRNVRDLRYLSEFLVELSEWKGFEKSENINISNKFDITVEYDKRITLYFGNRYDLGDKLNIINAVIDSYSESASGTLNVKNINEGIARIVDPANTGQEEIPSAP